jgi:transcriptional regulator with XRE-family HTH domain
MKKPASTEKLLLEEVTQSSKVLAHAARGLTIGDLIKLIRNQLTMSQGALAKRAGIPQSTVSRVESNQKGPNVSTLSKILDALSCDLLVIPMLREPTEVIRRRQARHVAQQHVKYLRGTMSLEKQEPDRRLLDELIKKEEEELLYTAGTKLWEE